MKLFMEFPEIKNLGGIILEPINLDTSPKTVLINLILIYLAKMNTRIKWPCFFKEVFLHLQTLKAILKKLNKKIINK